MTENLQVVNKAGCDGVISDDEGGVRGPVKDYIRWLGARNF